MISFIHNGTRTLYGNMTAFKAEVDSDLQVSGGYGVVMNGRTVWDKNEFLCDRNETISVSEIDETVYNTNVKRGLILTVFAPKE